MSRILKLALVASLLTGVCACASDSSHQGDAEVKAATPQAPKIEGVARRTDQTGAEVAHSVKAELGRVVSSLESGAGGGP